MFRTAAALGLCLAVSLQALAAPTIIKVSPDGAAPGTVTLSAAFELLKSKKLRSPGGEPTGPIVVELAAGTYRLIEPLKLDAASSGTAQFPVVIRGPADRSAIISGGRAVNGFAPVTDAATLARLPAAARAHVLQTNLPVQGITDFGVHMRHGFGADGDNPTALELTYRNQPLTLARWPNDKFTTIATTPDGEKGLRFTLEGANLAAWQAEPQLMATGYWHNNWADTTVPVKAVDVNTGKLTLAAPSPPYGIKAGQRVFIQNALAELDQAGEWYLDIATGTLYLWPEANPTANDVEASLLHQLLAITNASYITISRITFQSTRGDAITITGGHHVQLANSTIRNIGGRGVVISGHDNGVVDMLIEHTGASAIVLNGGDRQTLTPANLYVARSALRRFARVSRTLQFAVQIDGVGNRAVGNTISDSPHTAILFMGNDHLIANNNISKVCLETGDAGVIYTGRDWTARGTVIANNYLHSIPPNITWGKTKGVYLDDQASGIIIRGNLFDQVDEAIFIGGGRDNTIQDNVFRGGEKPIHIDARGLTWQKEMVENELSTLRKRLNSIPYTQSPFKERYPNLKNILKDEPGAPKYNITINNKYIEVEDK